MLNRAGRKNVCRRWEHSRRRGEKERGDVLSAFRSMSSRAVNLSPFHGRQPGPVKRRWRRRRWEDRPRGAEVSLKDELSLTHTLALFLTNTVCLLFAVLTHTSAQASLPPSLFTPNFSRQFAFFCSFFSLLLTLAYHCSRWGRPPGVQEESWGAYRSQGAWLWDYEGRGLEAPKSHPSFPLIWKKGRAGSSLGEKEKKISQDHRNQGQPC